MEIGEVFLATYSSSSELGLHGGGRRADEVARRACSSDGLPELTVAAFLEPWLLSCSIFSMLHAFETLSRATLVW